MQFEEVQSVYDMLEGLSFQDCVCVYFSREHESLYFQGNSVIFFILGLIDLSTSSYPQNLYKCIAFVIHFVHYFFTWLVHFRNHYSIRVTSEVINLFMGLCIEKPAKKDNNKNESGGQEMPAQHESSDKQYESQAQNDQEKPKYDAQILDTINTNSTEKVQTFYTILSPPISSGAYGEVRKCVHKVTGQVRAVKIINKSNATPEEIARVLNEVEILKRLDHPSIVKLYEIYQNDWTIYIVTEYCKGGELFDAICKQSRFSERDAAKVMHQVFQAIYYCHLNRIVHRDLKPENIVFMEENDAELNIKVIDFGTSRSFDRFQKLNQRTGTPYYIAPEVLKRKYDEKCDIWSCGVVLYIMLCGYPPFNGPSDSKILEKVAKGEYDFDTEEWDIISEDAKEFIKKMLQLDPSRRYSAQQCLQDPWFARFVSEQNEESLPQITKALNNMRSFKNTQRLTTAIYMYIVNLFTSNEEKKELLKTFKALDLNNDGLLSREELLIGMKKMMDEESAEEEVKRIMGTIDTNHSDQIDFSEFVAASINRQQLLSQQRLKMTFEIIDKDGSGKISLEELKQVFGNGQIPDDVWKQIIAEVDDNADSHISYSEFCEMMGKLVV